MATKIMDNTPNTQSTAQNVHELSIIVDAVDERLIAAELTIVVMKSQIEAARRDITTLQGQVSNLITRVTALENA